MNTNEMESGGGKKDIVEMLAREDGVYFVDGGCYNNGTADASCYGGFKTPFGMRKRFMFKTATTNNQAEYRALIALLKRLPFDVRAVVKLDSRLVVHQVGGRWKINDDELRCLCAKAKRLLAQRPKVTLEWVGNAVIKRELGF